MLHPNVCDTALVDMEHAKGSIAFIVAMSCRHGTCQGLYCLHCCYVLSTWNMPRALLPSLLLCLVDMEHAKGSIAFIVAMSCRHGTYQGFYCLHCCYVLSTWNMPRALLPSLLLCLGILLIDLLLLFFNTNNIL